MCTVNVAPEARSTGPHTRAPPVSSQEGWVALALCEESPDVLCRGLFTVTLRAMPAPLLVTVTSNPMVSPAETGPAGLEIGRASCRESGTSTVAEAEFDTT